MPGEKFGGVEREDVPREECGVFAAFSPDGIPDHGSLAEQTYVGLLNLQHRGEDAAGIAIYDERQRGFTILKDEGLVTSVFGEGRHLRGLVPTHIAIGHVRYGTAGEGGPAAAHPLYGEAHRFTLALNGHIAEMEDPTGRLTDTQRLVRHLDTHYDDNLRRTLLGTLRSLTGGYSLVASDGVSLIGARDPWGFRPLSFGHRDGVFFFASEDSALKDMDAVYDVRPGEMITVGRSGIEREMIYEASPTPAFCAMEESYFARPDSNFNGRNVQQTRYDKGRLMARQERQGFSADIVVGVPESGVDDALGYAAELGIPYKRAITKNPYIGRTFIQSTQEARTQAARQKFRITAAEVAGREVVVVDDSLVRGTNSKVLVQMLREAGADQIHLRIMYPEHRFPCRYGIDTGNPAQLLANRMSKDEMREYLGVDSIEFLTAENLEKAISPKLGGLCMACVTGNYPTQTKTQPVFSAESLFVGIR